MNHTNGIFIGVGLGDINVSAGAFTPQRAWQVTEIEAARGSEVGVQKISD
jgi:hypothetical protein